MKLDGSPDRARAVEVMASTLEALEWRRPDKATAVHFTEIGANALHYRCFAWIDSRLDEPLYTSMMLTALVDALDDAGISVGETANVSAADFVVSRNDNSGDDIVDLREEESHGRAG